MIRIGIDTGGTFTDLIAIDTESERWFTAKVPSDPVEPLNAILAVIKKAGLDLTQPASLILGTTVGTNALLERKGAKLAYITTAGFEDIPYIQRGNRKYHYDLHWIKPHPFVDRADCLGVTERVDYKGQIETPLQLDESCNLIEEIRRRIDNDGLQAVAVSLLFSYLNPEHELKLEKHLAEHFPDLAVSLSHRVAPIWREYERGLTTIADAYLKPLLEEFIESVDTGLRALGFKGDWALMKSNGGMRLAESAAKEPVQLLLSGLAGGVMGGKIFGLAHSENLITFDIGGTSSDIAVISAGEQRYSMQYEVEFGLPLQLPTIDVTTIGAGGGSIAWVDGGGFLRVGPQSAGAQPGPACYDRGGTEPTVTDANLVLGRLNPDYFLGGQIKLKTALAETAIAALAEKMGLSLQQTALAIINIANDNMMNAVRLRTVEVGIDPSAYCLVGFGGAGALHASAVARSLGIRQVVIPPYPGLCSAFGALAADLRCDRIWTTSFRSDLLKASKLDELLQRLSVEAIDEVRKQNFAGEIRVQAKLALRYQGQNYEHDIDIPDSHINEAILKDCYAEFNKLHDAFYGYNLSGEVIEIVNIAVTAIGETERKLPSIATGKATTNTGSRPVCFSGESTQDTPVYARHSIPFDKVIAGPAIIEEVDSTTLLEPGDELVHEKNGSLLIRLRV